MTQETQAPDAPSDDNHIRTVRRHLMDQMQALRGAKEPADMERELARGKGLSELAQVLVNTAKVEVDYLKVTGQPSTPFMKAPPDQPQLPDAGSKHDTTRLPAPGNGITSITQHRLKG
ncbi:hypothetical protein [Aquabacterium sp.]|uniref:hypothetical protein n=1 Tax=Aquabacterium sp. TaxID=1872578 RepID=UPI0025BA1F45|nr:hypothetical protein [Aquabacterium sp.]